ncbi:MAG: T9SS type A sorting domain-containing protein [Bacteroidia bacterium]|nr:T9SS type A sorting domain-containing protein [Bacteroidia bacterium]MDW8333438.1 T9SS type A sorting domain-containing protein [Bacteroidia bacterium]
MKRMARTAALGAFCAWTCQLWAQKFNWETIGPDNIGGRVRALHVTTDGKVYAGGAGSGLWISSVAGFGWTPVETFNNAQGVRSLCVSSIAQDGTTIYVATGELAFKFDFDYITPVEPKNIYEFGTITKGYPNGLGQPGAGVFVSENGGPFSNVNATCGSCVQDGFDAENPWISVQKVVAQGGRAFAATFRGLYYTDDKFRTVNLASTSVASPPSEARFDPERHALENNIVYDVEIGSNGRIYAATRSHLFISTDNGATFSIVRGYDSFYREQSDASLDRNRIEISVAPGLGQSGQDLVYLVEVVGPADGYHAGVWMSDDGGATFNRPVNRIGPPSTFRGGSGNPIFAPLETTGFSPEPRGLFSCVLEYDRANPQRVIFGGQQLWEYTPEKNWIQISQPLFPRTDPQFVAAPICAIAFDPSNPRRFFLGTSQEIVRTNDGGKTYEKLRHGFDGALALGVAETAGGKIFAAFDGASVGLLSPQAGKSFQFLPTTRKYGKVAASIYDPKHLVAGGQYGGVRRSLNEGEVFELFTGASIAASYDDEFVVVSPTLLNETFLSDTIFGSPGERGKWVLVNGNEPNRWVMGRGAGNPFARDEQLAPNALYISANPSAAVPTYGYDVTERAVCHVYRDFIIPFTTKLDGAKLDFWYKANGEQNVDELRIFAAPISFVPQAGETPSGTNVTLLGRFHQSLNNDWKNETINLPNNLIGQKIRLIFTWVNDNAGGGGQPAAIDHITLTADNEIIGEDQFTQAKTPFPWSAFVLDEVAADGDTALNTEQKPVNEQYLFVGVNDQVWCVRTPFGASTGDVDDVLPTWTRITPHNNNANAVAITAMAVSGDSTHTLFYGNSLGEIYRIRNAHRLDGALERAVRISPSTGLPRRWIRSLTVHPRDPNVVVVTYAYYGERLAGTAEGSQIFITYNALSSNPTFRSLHGVESLPFVPIHCAYFNDDPNEPWLMIGTERGVYVLANPLSQDFWPSGDNLLFEPPTPEDDWQEANDGDMLPVPVYDISHKKWTTELRYKPDTVVVGADTTVRYLPYTVVRPYYEGHLYIATLGRGVLRSAITVGRNEPRRPLPPPASFEAKIYPNPTRNEASVRLNDLPRTTLRISLLDALGREIWSASEKVSGNVELSLPTAGRSPGIYYVRLAAPGFAPKALKLIVER